MLRAYLNQLPLGTWLKLLGIVTMTIDHVGMVFFPDQIAWRLVGRLALPIFLFGIVEGDRHTHSHGKYITRLLVCGVISQPIFSAVAHTSMLNICFSLALALGMLYGLGKIKGDLGRTAIVIAAMMAAWTLNVDYGIYGVLFTLVLWATSQTTIGSRKQRAVVMVSMTAIFHLFVFAETQLVGLLGSARFGLRQTLAVVSVAIIAYVTFLTPPQPRRAREVAKTTTGKLTNVVRRYGFYAYYPLHLAIIGLVYSWIQ